MEVFLLGPLEVRDENGVVVLPRRQQRALVAALALRAGEVVSTDRLIADLWGERAPASARGSLQNTVSGLRALLGREALVTQEPGYRLAIAREAVDADRFEALVAEARAAAGPRERVALLQDALALWRGPALADLDEEEFARRAAGRLEELRTAALEQRIDADLELGRHSALVGELEQLVAATPPREGFHRQLMLALYRCGRQAEALEVYRALRLALADELGLDPSPELQELERKILNQDSSLAAPAETEDDDVPAEPSERRLVTVLVARPPTADDPERHRALLDRTLASMREALDRHGGTPERFGPEALVMVFGAEAARDDDAERAVLVARELGLDAGVATGETVDGAGAVYTRATELARVGGIRLDERTAAIVRSGRRLDRPLVGRDTELAQLRAQLAEARETRSCRIVTVVGQPGIGKTRLARELALREGGEATVLVARCAAYGTGATFIPLLGALRRAEPEEALAGETDGELVLARLGALAEGEAPLGESYWAVRRFLESLARRAPVLLVLDDVHWAGTALLDLVEYLGDRAEAPLLVLCLARPELERTLGETTSLGRLADAEARAIVADTAELDQATQDHVVAAAEGNPLYAEQLTRFAAESGEGLPPSLEAVLAGRLGRLQARERAVLQRAAVLGREFTVGGVTALAQEEVTRELLALARAGFVHPVPADPGDDGYTFHHVLLRDAAYAGLTKADRADLHQRAAAWIDRDGPCDDALAGYHLEQAVRWRGELGQDADELAAAAGERLGNAGMRSWRASDLHAAIGLLERAVALLPASERRAELSLELSLAYRIGGHADEAARAGVAAEEDARAVGSKRLLARVECERAQTSLMSGDLTLDEAAATVANAIPAIRAAGDSRGLARAELILSNVHWFACRLEELAAAAARAELHYREAGFSGGVAVGIQAEALYHGPTPVPQALTRCAELLERLPTGPAQAVAMTVLGALRGLEGDLTEARSLLAHARSLFEEFGNEGGILTTWTSYVVEVEATIGDPAAARAAARSNIEGLMSMRDIAHATSHAALFSYGLLDAGDSEGAEECVALAEAHRLGSDVYTQFMSRGARARLLAREGRFDAAEAMALDALAIVELTDALRDRARLHLAFGEVLELAGRPQEARAQIALARKLLRRKGARALLDRHRIPVVARP